MIICWVATELRYARNQEPCVYVARVGGSKRVSGTKWNVIASRMVRRDRFRNYLIVRFSEKLQKKYNIFC